MIYFFPSIYAFSQWRTLIIANAEKLNIHVLDHNNLFTDYITYKWFRTAEKNYNVQWKSLRHVFQDSGLCCNPDGSSLMGDRLTLYNYHVFLFFHAVDILLKATGDAPIMTRRKWAVDRTKKVGGIIEFIWKYLKLDQESLVRTEWSQDICLFAWKIMRAGFSFQNQLTLSHAVPHL